MNGRPRRRPGLRPAGAWRFRGLDRWPSVVALVVLVAATVVGWYWVWGVFFLYWAVYGVVVGRAFVVQQVLRQESPVLFWLVTVTWLVLSVLTVVYDAVPRVAPGFSDVWLGAAGG